MLESRGGGNKKAKVNFIELKLVGNCKMRLIWKKMKFTYWKGNYKSQSTHAPLPKPSPC